MNAPHDADRAPPRPLVDFLLRTAARVTLAALLLGVLECLWAQSLDVSIDAARLSAVLAVLAAALGVAYLIGALLLGATARLGTVASGVVDALVAAPVAWRAADSLFSGGWIRTVPLAGALQALSAVLLVAFAVLACRWTRRARVVPGARHRLQLAGLALLCLGSASAADNLVEVGHYRSFHLLLGAILLWSALLLALLAWPSSRPAPRVAGTLSLMLLSAVVAVWGTQGRGAPADEMVRYTNGLMPRLRLAAVYVEDDLAAALARVVDRQGPNGDVAPVVAPAPDLLRAVDDLDPDWWRLDGDLERVAGTPPRLRAGAAGGALTQQVLTPLRVGAQLVIEANLELLPDDAGSDGATPTEGTAAQQPSAAVDEGEPEAGAPEAMSPSAALVLTLPGPDGRHESAVALRSGVNRWSLEVDVTEAQPMVTASAAAWGDVAVVLDTEAIRAEEGLAFVVGLPAELERWADNRRESGTPGLVLLEDGHPLGPNQPVHQVIRDAGGGTYSHWANRLYLSTVDGSDPRLNGRCYELALPPPPPTTAYPTVSLSLHGAGRVVVRDISLRDTNAASSADLARSLADEFVLEHTPGPDADGVRAATRNVVVVLLDALRVDHLGPRADGTTLTPTLDALAAEGARFPCTYSPSDHTGRSVPCLVTSLPLEVTLRAADHAVPMATWLATLADRGFRSFNNGSDYIRRKYAHVILPDAFGAEETGTFDSKSDALCDEVIDFVVSDRDRPFAVYTHWSYAHVGRSRAMADEYAAMVRKCDAAVGRLVEGLKQAGEWDRTLLIVSADHGYGLGEGNRYLGAHGCAEFSVRVPLVLHVPGLPAAGVAPDHPVSNLSIASTVLDVLDPRGSHVVGAPSLLPSLLDPEGVVGGPVFSSTGAAWMTRHGDFKLTEENDYGTAAVFDVVRDPDEAHPLRDPRLKREMRELRRQEQERQSRLAQILVAGSGRDLAPEVLATFARNDLDADAVKPLLLSLWSYDAASREYLLSELYRRRIDDLGPILDGARRGRQDRDDDLLLVLRAWAGGADALDELAARLDDLHADALVWLAAMLVDFQDEETERLAPGLVATAQRLWSAAPAIDSLEGRTVALLCRGLGRHLPAERLGPVKDIAVELYDAWSAVPGDGFYFASLEDRKFGRRSLLEAFTANPVSTDLERVSGMPRNRDFVELAATICARLDTPKARAWMLDLLRDWQGFGEDPPGKFLTSAIPILRSVDDAAFRADADAVLRSRFPDLPSILAP